jgi:hypothetical protein
MINDAVSHSERAGVRRGELVNAAVAYWEQVEGSFPGDTETYVTEGPELEP